MKKLPLLSAIFSLLMVPTVGYAQELYAADANYKCTPVKQEKAPIVRKAAGEMVTQFTLELSSNDQQILSFPADLDGNGKQETVRSFVQSISNESIETVVTVQDSAEYETVVYSNVMTANLIPGNMILTPVTVNGKTYLRVIQGLNAYSAVDIDYQGRGKFTRCHLADAVNIRNDMQKFLMRNAPK